MYDWIRLIENMDRRRQTGLKQLRLFSFRSFSGFANHEQCCMQLAACRVQYCSRHANSNKYAFCLCIQCTVVISLSRLDFSYLAPAVYVVFTRPQATTAMLSSYLPSLCCKLILYRWCVLFLSIRKERFRGSQKGDERVGLSVFLDALLYLLRSLLYFLPCCCLFFCLCLLSNLASTVQYLVISSLIFRYYYLLCIFLFLVFSNSASVSYLASLSRYFSRSLSSLCFSFSTFPSSLQKGFYL
jgi:hypothetical protein